MTREEFEILISKDESSTLDFKKEHYKFEKGNELQIAKFIKDIIAFSNTIRDTTAHILIGIEEENGNKLHHGIEGFIDDAIFQDKIKDKVDPKPKFSCYTFNYNGLIYGIIEIPIKRYSKPIMPTKSLNGLEPGKIYFRRGSSNSEATHQEAIEINNWITKINTPESIDNIKKRLIELISAVNSSQFISPFLAESMQIGNDIKNSELYGFCKNELLGWTNGDKSINSEHRTLSCLVSFNRIKSINNQIGTTISTVWAELEQNGGFKKHEIIFGENINQLEEQIKSHEKNANQYLSMPISTEKLFPESNFKNNTVYLYWNEHNINATFARTKQRFIQLLTESLLL